jgi:1,4-alpha-glucan branching enzyme
LLYRAACKVGYNYGCLGNISMEEQTMLKKTTLASGKKVKVTFELPANGAKSIAVAGDFNGWDKEAAPLKKRKKDGVWSVSLNLPVGQSYQFKYWIDGVRWENDWAADDYVPNGFGGDNSVVRT